MAHIKAFRGVVYNRRKTGNLASVVAPPYDVISKKQQHKLYKANPHNIIRLEFGKIKPGDNARENRYTRARRYFEEWLKKGVLMHDDRESIYVYSQSYKDGIRTIDRIGFFALMALDSGKGKKVLPHENTLVAPKLDRLDVMRNVRANLSPIYVLYDDVGSKVTKILKRLCDKNKPFMDIYFEGIRNRAWKLDDHKAIATIEKLMSGKNIFIADGHHRYEVARMYSKEVKRKGASNHVMMYLVASDEKMLTVLPTHRVVKDMSGLSREEVVTKLSKYFKIQRVGSLKVMMQRINKHKGSHAFGLYMGKKKYYVLVLKDVKASDAVVKNKPKDWKRLDVVILHKFILSSVLGVEDVDDNIEFVKSPQDTVSAIDKGGFKAAFFLNASKVSEIKRIAKIGEKMPRKATYFFPKPITGVVIHKH